MREFRKAFEGCAGGLRREMWIDASRLAQDGPYTTAACLLVLTLHLHLSNDETVNTYPEERKMGSVQKGCSFNCAPWSSIPLLDGSIF